MKKKSFFAWALAMGLACGPVMAQEPTEVALTTAKAVGEEVTIVTNQKKVQVDWGDGNFVDVSAADGAFKGQLKGKNVKIKAAGLRFLDCSDNGITALSFDNAAELTTLYCANNKFSTINLTGCRNLKDLDCSENELISLSLAFQKDLEKLNCAGNELKSISLSAQPKLQVLICSDNELSSLSLNSQTALKTLWCDHNNLTTLNLSRNGNLESLDCSGNKIKSLSGLNATAIVDFWCDDNQLEQLSLAQAVSLETLSCTNNKLKKMTLGALKDNHKALAFYCEGNYLTYGSFYSLSSIADEVNVAYNPQNPFDLPKKRIKVDEQITLDGIAENAEGDGTSARYTWKKGDTELVKGSKDDYIARGNKFTFKKPFAGIQCEVTSPKYPDLTLVSEPLDVIDGTGIEEVMQEYGFQYVTNAGSITMKSDKPYRVAIYTTDGKQVWTGIVSRSDVRVSLGHGIYLVNGIKISL